MPPLDILVKEFHVDEPVAFHMLRGKLTAEMKKAHRIEGDALQRRLDAEKAEAERVKDQPDSAGTSEESAVEAETAVAKVRPPAPLLGQELTCSAEEAMVAYGAPRGDASVQGNSAV